MYSLNCKTGQLCTHCITRQANFVLTKLQGKTSLYSLHYRQGNFVLALLHDKSSLYSHYCKTSQVCTHIIKRQVKFAFTLSQDKSSLYSHYYKKSQVCTHIITRQVKFVLTALSNWHIAMFPSHSWVSCVTP